MITLDNVSQTYWSQGEPFLALKDINLTIDEGEIFGVIGKSGAGKSTLVRCINALEAVSAGTVEVAGEPISSLSPAALRRARQNMGMIFQHFNLLSSRTAYENIALPLELRGDARESIHHRVNELLRLVELDAHANAYPKDLSGGQKQRVAIARALATEPAVLLCDEATSALDPETTIAILSLLKKINETLGITIVIITHEMDVIKQICHRVAVIDAGQIVEVGRVIDIFVHPQSDVAKRLTQAALHLDLPSSFDSENSQYPIVRLAFVEETAKIPLTSLLHKQFSVSCNILQADLEVIAGQTVGFMVCELIGEVENAESAIAFLKSKHVDVEVLSHVK